MPPHLGEHTDRTDAGRCLQDRHNVGLPNGRQWARPSPFAGLRLREVVGSWSFHLGRRAAFQLRAQLSLMIQRWVNVCGERCIITDRNLFLFGSAPRVRGTGHLPMGSESLARFSPACAGNGSLARRAGGGVSSNGLRPTSTRLRIGTTEDTAVQPRVFGERISSSDMARTKSRFSPACAN